MAKKNLGRRHKSLKVTTEPANIKGTIVIATAYISMGAVGASARFYFVIPVFYFDHWTQKSTQISKEDLESDR